jgi:hypothetical protein
MALDSYTDTKSTWYDGMNYIGVSGTRDTRRGKRGLQCTYLASAMPLDRRDKCHPFSHSSIIQNPTFKQTNSPSAISQAFPLSPPR